MENDGFQRLDRKLVYKAHLFDLYEDTVQVPNGNVAKWDYIGHKGAAAVVPVLEDGRILMVNQFRNALDRMAIEVPAGGRESTDEPYIDCAKRELEEETGFKCEYEDMEFLLSLKTTVAFCNEQIEIYVVRNLKKSEQHLDEDEVIHIKAYEPSELRDLIFAGKIQDGKTIAAIMAYLNKYNV
ncbi:MAG: NUDIX hydrolase [Lachnospiraceae bacterium]|nr:NUDIX hydrolase [Lachnospiraceae bacterium]